MGNAITDNSSRKDDSGKNTHSFSRAGMKTCQLQLKTFTAIINWIHRKVIQNIKIREQLQKKASFSIYVQLEFGFRAVHSTPWNGMKMAENRKKDDLTINRKPDKWGKLTDSTWGISWGNSDKISQKISSGRDKTSQQAKQVGGAAYYEETVLGAGW